MGKWFVPWGLLIIGVLAMCISTSCYCCWRRRRRRKSVRASARRDSERDGADPLFNGRQELPPAVGALQPVPESDEEALTFIESPAAGLKAAPFEGAGVVFAAQKPSDVDVDSRRLDVQEQLEDPYPAVALRSMPASQASQIPPAALAKWTRTVYARYNPKKLHTVDKLIADHKGREQELVDSISTKYRLHPVHFERHYSRSTGALASCGGCGEGLDGCSKGFRGGGAASSFAGVVPVPEVAGPRWQK